jgi:Domain of unknown function (DUF6484)
MTIANETNGGEGEAREASSLDPLRQLLDGPANLNESPKYETGPFGGVVVGELLGIRDQGRTPIVSYRERSGAIAAVAARSIVDLQAIHIGKQVVLMFEDADPARPIILGALRSDQRVPFETRPGRVEVDADGERLIFSARETLVLQCGNASITLTKDGKVVLRGTHLTTHASGVNRIKGGSVQIN